MRKIIMMADCDLRTQKLVEKAVAKELRESHGPECIIELISIRHKELEVVIQGAFAERLGEEMRRFAMKLPRADGPLDCFL